METDVILKNGRFYSGEDVFHGSMAINDGKISELGSFDDIRSRHETDTIVDLEGKTVFPGFIDSHIHLVQTGFLQIHVDLSEAKSIDDLKEIMKTEVKNKKPGEWIIGSSFDDNKFENERVPKKSDLDKIAPDNPVVIIRVCTHLMVANSKALELAGIDENREAPEGGEIERDENGSPTGLLRRNAADLIYSIIYSDSEMIKKAIRASLNHLKENGITTAHSMAIAAKNREHYFNIMKAYQEVMVEESYPVRVKLGAECEILEHLLENDISFLHGDDYFNQGYIKFFTDGSFGTRTALLNEPYFDDPNNYGLESTPKDTLYKYAKMAHENGYQCSIHALGDKALSNALDVLEELTQDGNPLRHRIVHAGLAPVNLIKRIKRCNIPVDIQPNFIASELDWLEYVLSSRAQEVYTWKTMKNHGITLAASSDSPVEPVNPFYGIRAAVTRQNLENRPAEGFNPNEKLTIKEAVDMYTLNGAYQYFEENYKGSISPGKLADLVVLSNNPVEVNDYDDLLDIQVDMTFVGGRLVYQCY